jgi:hypothetical protein
MIKWKDNCPNFSTEEFFRCPIQRSAQQNMPSPKEERVDIVFRCKDCGISIGQAVYGGESATSMREFKRENEYLLKEAPND